MTGGDDDGGGLFGRPVSTLADGGTMWRDLKRALAYPRTMSRETFLKGGVLFFSTLFVFPLPLLVGHALRVGGDIGRDVPAPDFAHWKRDYLRGVGIHAATLAVLFVPLFGIALVVTVLGQNENPAVNDAMSGFVVVWWLYATPWAIGVYANGSWRSFLDGAAWRWAFSPNYLATVLVTAVLLTVGYFAFALSIITIVGWAFVGFLVLAVLSGFLGQRYDTYRTARGISDADAAGSAASPGLLARLGAAVPTGATTGSATATTAASGDGAGAAAGTGSATTGGDESGQTETAEADPEGNDPEESEYVRLRERARRVDRRGPIDRLEAGDGGRIGYLSVRDEHDGEEARAAFERTVDRWNGISHNPGVTTVFESDSDPAPWVAFDPLDGPLTAVGGDLSGPEVIAVTESVADAVTTGRMYNIAHREISPYCVYVERGGGTEAASQRITATLADWGLAHELLETAGEDGRDVRYLAPEQFGGGAADDAVDVYQLAAVAHYALLGEAPFASAAEADVATSERSVSWTPPADAGLSESAVETFERALATDPDERFDGTDAFLRALRSALQ